MQIRYELGPPPPPRYELGAGGDSRFTGNDDDHVVRLVVDLGAVTCTVISLSVAHSLSPPLLALSFFLSLRPLPAS